MIPAQQCGCDQRRHVDVEQPEDDQHGDRPDEHGHAGAQHGGQRLRALLVALVVLNFVAFR